MFENIKGKLGFGCMRLPMKDKEVDYAETCRMVDAFLEAGFNYFDTAHGYIDGKSETALRECRTSRHPRESYILTDKLTTTRRRRFCRCLKSSWKPAAWNTLTFI